MLVDFQHHYTPPGLIEIGKGDGTLRLDENGNPNYRFNPAARRSICACAEMMDRTGIDLAVLSCGSGFDQADAAKCRLINDHMHHAERDYPGRFIGLAHVPAHSCGWPTLSADRNNAPFPSRCCYTTDIY